MLLQYYKWTLSFAPDVISRSPLQPQAHVCVRIIVIIVVVVVVLVFVVLVVTAAIVVGLPRRFGSSRITRLYNSNFSEDLHFGPSTRDIKINRAESNITLKGAAVSGWYNNNNNIIIIIIK